MIVLLLPGHGWAQTPQDDLATQAHRLRQIIATMEIEAAELEPQVEAARSALRDLTAAIETTTGELEREQKGLAGLRNEAATARIAAEEVHAEETEVQATIAAATEDLAEMTETIGARRAELDQLTQRMDQLRAAEQQQVDRLASLEAEAADTASLQDDERSLLRELQAQLEQVRAELADLTGQRDAMQAELDRSQGLSAQIEADEQLASALAEPIQTLDADATAQEPVQAPETPDPAPAPNPLPQSSPDQALAADDQTRQPRDLSLVSAVLATTPGLPQSSAARDQLRKLLVEGECRIDALRQVQDPINRQALLVLLTGLDGC